MSLLDKATLGASCVYWEALKVDFALETLDKEHQYVSRTCLWPWRSERWMSVNRFLKPTSHVEMFLDDLKPECILPLSGRLDFCSVYPLWLTAGSH